MFYPGFEYLKYSTPDTSELTIISINLYKIVDSALQSAYKLEVTFHHGNTRSIIKTIRRKVSNDMRRDSRHEPPDTRHLLFLCDLSGRCGELNYSKRH